MRIPLGATALLVAFAPLPFDMPYAQNEARKMARLVYFPKTDPAAGVASYAIQYGAPAWKEAYAQQFEAPQSGRRWRFGRDHWTTLDTNVPLKIGEGKKTKLVKPGLWYLVLESDKSGGFRLAILDPDKVRKQRMDAFSAHATKGGILVPAVEKGELQKQLAITLKPVAKDSHEAELAVSFGPYVLTTRIEARI